MRVIVIQLVLVSKAEMIDELDRKLIQELQRSNRQSYVDLARMLGVVEGTVRKRVKDLQDRK
ncbi:AsnC family transcriptional regulator [Dehalococcoidia bacterium]|nr:AsnC family transcriptional regulator [Dehalococcoidia bacterium]MCL0060058.1 AsnC family transcriptional regulator [Dehalococcoidia bacterium]MCL0064255.1 AsnC family transcriptional regulator [Dehalococcoidia bacterium]MCL0073121.1 AsnC family transcriptional regulator [Dehalococcoidia bacterium]MCL0082747.1 AsnC family transcriptional regulator [Dehalococcoidia bacterium]